MMPVYRTLPAGNPPHPLECTTEAEIEASWGASCAPIVRAALDRGKFGDVVVHAGQRWLSRWRVRWLAARVAAVMRCDVRDLIDKADAMPLREGDTT